MLSANGMVRIDLGEYRRGIMNACPETRFYLSRFAKEVSLTDILDAEA